MLSTWRRAKHTARYVCILTKQPIPWGQGGNMESPVWEISILLQKEGFSSSKMFCEIETKPLFVMYYSKIENYFYTIEINESFSMFHRFSMCAHGADVKMALRTLFPWPTCNVTIKQLPTISLCELALPASTVKTAFSSRTPKTKMKLVKTKWPRQMIESLITSSFSRPHMPIQNSVIWQFSYV